MTPLPRWVFLASVVAVAVAHPLDHACVRLCGARYGNPDTTEVCNHRRKLVLQYNGGRFPIELLHDHCLTPCNDPNSLRSLYDVSTICRDVVEEIIEEHGCTCDFLDYGAAKGIEEGREYEPVDVEQDWLKLRDMLMKMGKEEASVDERLTWRSSHAEDKKKILGGKDFGVGEVEMDPTKDDSVDWDLWCMVQCGNGKGGSACHCDIIP